MSVTKTSAEWKNLRRNAGRRPEPDITECDEICRGSDVNKPAKAAAAAINHLVKMKTTS
jgi:hypothetical protein